MKPEQLFFVFFYNFNLQTTAYYQMLLFSKLLTSMITENKNGLDCKCFMLGHFEWDGTCIVLCRKW